MVFPTCVSCCKNGKRGKLLKCLHTVCVGCLEKFVTRQGEVRCPDCAQITPSPSVGKSQLLCLPDSPYNVSISSAESQTSRTEQPPLLLCDECGEDESAASKCADCGSLLCALHSQTHPRSRASLRHRVEAIENAGADWVAKKEEDVKFCPLHPSRKLQTFCTTCRELLCELCVSAGCCDDSSQSLKSVQDAAAMMRTRIEAKVSSRSADGSEVAGNVSSSSVVSEAVDRVSGAIKELHNQTEAVSDQVEKHFQDVHKLVDARQGQVLEDLDQLRSAKLLPLEDQKQRLLKSQHVEKSVSSLLSSCKDACDFLRMGSWLEEAADIAKETAQKDSQPCVVSRLVFTPGNESDLAASIAKSGGVLDAADLDTSRSTVRCAASVTIQQDLTIEVEAMNSTGQAISQEIGGMPSLRVVVTSPAEESVKCNPEFSADGKCLVAKYRPAVLGEHRVTTTHGECHLTGSPAQVMVTPQEITFEPDRSHPDIQLSNGNRTASQRDRINTFRAVRSASLPKEDVVNIRVRIDNAPSHRVVLLLCKSANPPLDSWKPDTTMFGWCGNSLFTGQVWRGSALGQPWKSGDVIRLSLDCNRHTLTGCHERTGATETLSDVSGDLSLYVLIHYAGTQVTIL